MSKTKSWTVLVDLADRRISRSSGVPGAVSIDHVRAVGSRFKRALFNASVAAAVNQRGIATLDFTKDTTWDEFLVAYLKANARKP